MGQLIAYTPQLDGSKSSHKYGWGNGPKCMLFDGGEKIDPRGTPNRENILTNSEITCNWG